MHFGYHAQRNTKFTFHNTKIIKIMRYHIIPFTLLFILATTVTYSADAEQAAFLAAVKKVSPSVVRIETIGGDERVGRIFTVPETTGVVLAPDGWIITSSFGLAHQPDAVFVLLADGSRHAAKIVMTDRNRKLTLLKVDLPEHAAPLTVPEVAPRNSFHPGQHTLTLGRVLDTEEPSVTAGVLSAVNRIWGKAIQTDAVVSPNNYGGPLFDIHGRVMGIITPFPMDMSSGNPQNRPRQRQPGIPDRPPEGDKEAPKGTPEIPVPGAEPGAPQQLTPAQEAFAGMDLYDSGIGFAVPLETIYELLPRMQKNDLKLAAPMGVGFSEEVPIFAAPVIKMVQPDSAAAKAGLEMEDKILTFNGVPVPRVADLRDRLFPLYAGDSVTLTVLRKDETKTFTFPLEESK